jgi:transmembrane sensor
MAKLLKFPARRRVAEETSAWLGRLDRGLQPDERAELEAWLAADPVHGQTLLRMAALWDNLDVLGELSELIALPQSRERAAGWRPAAVAVAIVVVALASLAGYLHLTRPAAPTLAGNVAAAPPPEQTGVVETEPADPRRYSTRIGEQRTERLPDGSLVQLNTASSLEVSYDDAVRRITLLAGEAQFAVQHDASRPFIVEAQGRTVRAVGTAFNVRVRDQGGIEVAVTEGRVLVAAAPMSADEMMTPSANDPGKVAASAGQVVSIDGDRLTLQTVSTEEMSDRLAWQRGMLMFDGEPLASALSEVTRYTGVRFEFEDEQVAQIRVGGFYKANDIEGLTRSLQQNLPIRTTQVAPDRIVISSK